MYVFFLSFLILLIPTASLAKTFPDKPSDYFLKNVGRKKQERIELLNPQIYKIAKKCHKNLEQNYENLKRISQAKRNTINSLKALVAQINAVGALRIQLYMIKSNLHFELAVYRIQAITKKNKPLNKKYLKIYDEAHSLHYDRALKLQKAVLTDRSGDCEKILKNVLRLSFHARTLFKNFYYVKNNKFSSDGYSSFGPRTRYENQYVTSEEARDLSKDRVAFIIKEGTLDMYVSVISLVEKFTKSNYRVTFAFDANSRGSGVRLYVDSYERGSYLPADFKKKKVKKVINDTVRLYKEYILKKTR